MNRVTFLVDGFNLYHSVVDASRDLGGASTKWLDIHSFCKSYLANIGKDAKLERIYYFSAYAKHRQRSDPDVIIRHENYIKCLRATGINDILGRFKQRDLSCPKCGQTIEKHEEKETDVAIATKLLEACFLNECDTAVLVTGDTDILPAIKTALKHFPDKRVMCVFPYRRKNQELAQLVQGCFRVKADKYLNHQLPNPMPLPDGTHISKPTTW